MSNTSKLQDETLAELSSFLDWVLSPNAIWSAAILACSGILLLSLLVPSQILKTSPAVAGVGQNALIALILFACWQRAGPLVTEKFSRSLMIYIPVALAIVVIVQTLLLWSPQDGWLRLFVNTMPAPEAWQGRMSVIEACLLLLTFVVALLLRVHSGWAAILSGFAITVVLIVTATRATSYFLGIAEMAHAPGLFDALNPMLGGGSSLCRLRWRVCLSAIRVISAGNRKIRSTASFLKSQH